MNTPMTERKAQDLIRLVCNEGKTIAEVYELHPVEDVDGNPLGVGRNNLGGGTLGPVRLTTQQWEELAHYAAQHIPEERRRELIDSTPHLSWAEVARTFINELPQEGTND